MQFGLMFFASSEDSWAGNIYELVKQSAIFGDKNGFSRLWVPERHFMPFGGAYNTPAILHAAMAMITERIRLHSGSVVLPINDPIRIAEQWSMVDNLSNGRVGLSIASGWHPNDFIFYPDNYQDKHKVMYEGITMLKHLWQGGHVERLNGIGEQAPIKIYPPPIQKKLPLYLTVSSDAEGFKQAGAMGMNILTSLLDHTLEELTEKIVSYRSARVQNGHDPAAGNVVLMLHTFVGEDDDAIKEEARQPYCNFLKNNKGLMKGLASNRGSSFNLEDLTEKDFAEFANFLYDRFASSKGLIGSVDACAPILKQVENSGVNEIACLLDFGPKKDRILHNLSFLNKLKHLYV